MNEETYRFVRTHDEAQKPFLGTLHKVMIDKELEMVTTCSPWCGWHGPLHLFNQQFQRVQEAP